MPERIEITTKAILLTIALLLGLWFLWSIWGIILQFLIAVIIMTAFNPLVNRIENWRWRGMRNNRILAIITVYILFLFTLTIMIAIVTQPLISQTSSLVKQFPKLISQLVALGVDQSLIERQLSQLNALPGDIFRIITGIFSNILSVFTTLEIAFYLLLEREKLHLHLTSVFNNKKLEQRVEKFIDNLEVNLGGWVRAELLLMFIVGGLTYVGLLLLQIPYALPLAIIAGFLELIPNIGPTFAAIPAIIIGITLSPLVAVGVIALYVIIQLLENNLIVPQLMSRAIGVNPLITIVVLLIGFDLAGVMGAILAIPMVILLRDLIEYTLNIKIDHSRSL